MQLVVRYLILFVNGIVHASFTVICVGFKESCKHGSDYVRGQFAVNVTIQLFDLFDLSGNERNATSLLRSLVEHDVQNVRHTRIAAFSLNRRPFDRIVAVLQQRMTTCDMVANYDTFAVNLDAIDDATVIVNQFNLRRITGGIRRAYRSASSNRSVV